jgi:transposase
MKRQAYPSDLSDAEWAILAPLIPAPLPRGRPAKWERREIVNAILYVLRRGCSWQLMPHAFPPYQSVFYYFRRWQRAGIWAKVNTALWEQLRVQLGREAQPSAAIIDSQSAKTSEKGGHAATIKARM